MQWINTAKFTLFLNICHQMLKCVKLISCWGRCSSQPSLSPWPPPTVNVILLLYWQSSPLPGYNLPPTSSKYSWCFFEPNVIIEMVFMINTKHLVLTSCDIESWWNYFYWLHSFAYIYSY